MILAEPGPFRPVLCVVAGQYPPAALPTLQSVARTRTADQTATTNSFKWRTLWFLIPAAIALLLMRGCLEYFANMG